MSAGAAPGQATPRARGNVLFTKGDFAAAAAVYSEGLLPPSSTSPATSVTEEERALLLCNRAAAYIELGNKAAAEADGRACLQLQPCNFKAHFRLARSLPPNHEDAGPAIAAALALCGNDSNARSAAMLEVYSAIQRASAATAAKMMTANKIRSSSTPQAAGSHQLLPQPLLLELPEDPGRIAGAGDWLQVEAALRGGATLVILRPGTYTTSAILPPGRGLSYTLMAVPVPSLFPEPTTPATTTATASATATAHRSRVPGAPSVPSNAVVELRPSLFGGGTHAVWVKSRYMFATNAGQHPPATTLIGMRLAGNGRAAAICVDEGTELRLLRCAVEDYSEVGLLVIGGKARLDACNFIRTACQAIEVREGGQLEATRLRIRNCRQGVSAYGGARSAVLAHCSIQGCTREGVLAAGTYTNAATEAQPKVPGPSARSLSAALATEEAEAWGRAHGTQLNVTLLGCEISHCGVFGVSADRGASLVAQGCRLEGNDPYAAFIKGGTDASIVACQILVADAVSKSEWWRHVAGFGSCPKNPRQAGVQVGVNYGGCVNVVGCAFAGPRQAAIVEEMRAGSGVGVTLKEVARRMGMWSKPVVADRNSFHEASATVGEAAAGAGAAATSKSGAAATKEKKAAAAASADAPAAAGAAPALPSLESLMQRLPAWLALEGAEAVGAEGGEVLLAPGGRRRGAAATAAGAAAALSVSAPVLLQRTSHTFPRAAWAPAAYEYYAIGNTFGFDVTGGQLLQPQPQPQGQHQPAAAAAASATPAAAASTTSAGCMEAACELPPQQQGVVRILLAACGDIRNLLATAHAVLDPPITSASSSLSPPPPPPPSSTPSCHLHHRRCRLAFTLNDGNLAMLARNAALLHMAAELHAPASAVLAVWANHGLTAAHAELLRASLGALAEDPWPAWLSACTSLTTSTVDSTQEGGAEDAVGGLRKAMEQQHRQQQQRGEAEVALRAAFAAWAACKLPLTDLLVQRRERLGGAAGPSGGGLLEKAVQLSVEAVRAALGGEHLQGGATSGGGGSSGGGGGGGGGAGAKAPGGAKAKAKAAGTAEMERLRREVEEYVLSGSLKAEGGSGLGAAAAAAAAQQQQQQLVPANPTFLSAHDLQYTVYYTSSIFRAVPIAPSNSTTSSSSSSNSTTAWSRLLATLEPQLATTAAALRSGTMSVKLVPGDILAAMTAAGNTFSGSTAPSSSSSSAYAASVAAGVSQQQRQPWVSSPPLESFMSPAALFAPAATGAVGSSCGGVDFDFDQDADEFDFIYCTNVADYISLQALLQAAAPLLSRRHWPHLSSRLTAESMIVYGWAAIRQPNLTPAAFVESQLPGPSLPALHELLGLTFQGGKPVAGCNRAVRLEWVTAAAPSPPPPRPLSRPRSVSRGRTTHRDVSNGGGGKNAAAVAAGSGGGRSWLTAPRLLLELLPACRCLLTPADAPGAAPSVAPLALVHLLALTAPPKQADSLLRAAVRCDASGVAALFKWELTMHAQLQYTSGCRTLDLRRLSYAAAPGWALLGHEGDPLLLAFSREALPRLQPLTVIGGGGGGGGRGEGKGRLVKQLMSAFAWDEDLATAHLLLPEAILATCGDWFVTLCVLTTKASASGFRTEATAPAKSAGGGGCSSSDAGVLIPAGASVRVGTLPSQTAIATEAATAPVKWRPLGLPTLSLDLSLVEEVVAREEEQSKQKKTKKQQPGEGQHGQQQEQEQQQQQRQWQGRVHVCLEASMMTVDVLAPGPLPSAEAAAVVADVKGEEFCVTVVSCGSSSSRNGGKAKKAEVGKRKGAEKGELAVKEGEKEEGEEAGFVMRLPAGKVYGKPEGVKLNRRLGLLSARVPIQAAGADAN